MFEKQSNNNQNTPKAVAPAKGAMLVQMNPDQTEPLERQVYVAPITYGKRNFVRAVGPAGRFIVAGQVAKALVALVKAGGGGVTALEVNSWAYRLGAYVHTLRHDFGLIIETCKEAHEGGWHARYVLHSPVTIEAAR